MKSAKLFFAAIAVTVVLCVSAGHAQVTLIKAGKLIDPDSGTTTINQIIIVRAARLNPWARACLYRLVQG